MRAVPISTAKTLPSRLRRIDAARRDAICGIHARAGSVRGTAFDESH